ncbi:uncharacterized protein [Watersipora subatra]|uniref:uncharacterized protein n=1 Tax=Watersipora subatra TaxID=2589382 RepID=UPI00355C018C
MSKQMWHVHHMRFSNRHMKSLGDINMFSRIVILVLDHNYLESIDELINCRQLIKLDIHSNQISVLPDGMFWSQLQNLRILFAHDNPIGRVEAIHSLVACGRLQILTLYDSPLAIKRNYRHHVVNTIWSLKALDNYVVSDEEIIEDAVFKGTRFSTRSKAFEVDLSSVHPKPRTFEEELIAVRDLMARVNKIMAHFCPVLIIQKNIRFWLTYKRYRLYTESRIWAAMTIQQAWRKYKNLPSPHESDLVGDEIDNLVGLQYSSASPSGIPRLSKSFHTKKESFMAPSRHSSQIGKSSDRHFSTSSFNRRVRHGKRGVVIDWHKLQQISSEREDSLNARAIVTKAQKMTFKKIPGHVPGTRTIPAPPPLPGRKPLLHQKQFFGPVVGDTDESPTNHKHCIPETLPEMDRSYTHLALPLISSGYRTLTQPLSAEQLKRALIESDEVPHTNYRITGKKTDIGEVDMFEEAVLAKKELGQGIRDMETNFHEKVAREPVRMREKADVNLKERFLYERMQRTMGLSALTAVQQAYRDRELDEKRAVEMQRILMMKERRELAKQRVEAYHKERKLQVMANRDADRKACKDSLEHRERDIILDIDQSLTKRAKIKAHRKQRDAELKFSKEFITQQTSVSKALIRHDRQLRNDNRLNEHIEKVESMKDLEREQQEIVKKYLQHRKMLRQTENSMSRAALDTKMLQYANDTLYEARSRVDHLKSKEKQARQFTALPQTAHTAPILEAETPPTITKDIAEAIKNSRQRARKSGLPLYVPSPTRAENRPETRLTLSGGLARGTVMDNF